jgi:putative flippase GtrA
MADDLKGWHPDPFGVHAFRYFSLDGMPSRLVHDGGRTTLDPPFPAPPRTDAGTPDAADTGSYVRPITRQSIRPPIATEGTDPPSASDPATPELLTSEVLTPELLPSPPPRRPDGSQPRGEPALMRADPTELVPENVAESWDGPTPDSGTSTWSIPRVSTQVEAFSGANDERPLTDPQRGVIHRVLRYGSVSVISTATSFILLGIFVGILNFPAVWANILAIAIGTIPSFELNRRWVWAQNGQRSIARQVIPYCLLSFAGLIVSTIAVHLAADATRTSTHLLHTVAVELASIGTYGALWIFQFVLCDRILFRSSVDAALFADEHSAWTDDSLSQLARSEPWGRPPLDADAPSRSLVDAYGAA